MILDYGTQLSPYPITLSIGTLIKPKLQRIADISFNRFDFYEVLLKMSPKSFYTKIKGDEGIKYWNSLSEEAQNSLTLYNTILNEEFLIDAYIEVFNFFFDETVVFKDNCFILVDKEFEKECDVIPQDNIHGVISEKTFMQVLNIMQQICCIDDKEENIDNMKFKNKLARKMYEKMQSVAKKQKEGKKGNIDYTLPNIISSVSNKHPAINPTNVWELTIFQLLDSFRRMQTNSIYDIDSVRVSVWGDEKKTFNAALWYKNEYDKNNV